MRKVRYLGRLPVYVPRNTRDRTVTTTANDCEVPFIYERGIILSASHMLTHFMLSSRRQVLSVLKPILMARQGRKAQCG